MGKRITIQYFDDDGNRHEVVGMFERTDVRDGEPILHVRCRDDSVVSVRFGRIKAGRVVPQR